MNRVGVVARRFGRVAVQMSQSVVDFKLFPVFKVYTIGARLVYGVQSFPLCDDAGRRVC